MKTRTTRECLRILKQKRIGTGRTVAVAPASYKYETYPVMDPWAMEPRGEGEGDVREGKES